MVKTDFSQRLLTAGGRTDLHSNLCRGGGEFKGTVGEGEREPEIHYRKGSENYKGLISVDVIKSDVSASGKLLKQDSIPA